MVSLTQYTQFESFDPKKLDVFIQLGKDLGEDVLGEMLATYFQTTDESINGFKTCAVEKDFKSLARLAHKLKSSSGQLGLNKLHKLCTDLEHHIQNNTSSDLTDSTSQYLKLIFDETHLTTALLNDFLKAAA